MPVALHACLACPSPANRMNASIRREDFDRINKMYRMCESKNRSLSSNHPVNPVHPVQFPNSRSGARPRNLDRINRMNGMCKSKNRSLSSDHPVNPVHPVQFLNSCSGARRRNLDRINRMNGMCKSKNRSLSSDILSILFIVSNLLASPI